MALADGHVKKTDILTTTEDIGVAGKVIPTKLIALKNSKENRSSQYRFSESRRGGPAPFIDNRINTGDHLPITVLPYRMSATKKETLKQEIDRLLAEGITEECESPYASPVVLIPKANGTMRLCIDYRKLNSITVPDSYPLPRINDLLHEAKPTPFMSAIDLKAGYHQVKMTRQIQIHPDDQDKTALQLQVSVPLYSLRNVFLRHGIPRRTISDNGSQFVSAVLQQVCCTLNISQNLIPVYFPQSNPLEQKNRDLKPRLAILVGDDHGNWHSKLAMIRFAMNTAVCDTTGHTPAFPRFGRE
ncbi:Transposon Ty3-I Gag-Pol polyprotein like [Argiope bruennichi]|uniref:Transposon Ty3-I Gag-Pol polyprotein like n=1 Tax=Argiope bruennichi TaxID=94029 RepID=A0A8T0FHF0_ARGBR|nr:Transposon Ty3-I Gag-Pol polyprotein like [Argiope bruennichi]